MKTRLRVPSIAVHEKCAEKNEEAKQEAPALLRGSRWISIRTSDAVAGAWRLVTLSFF